MHLRSVNALSFVLVGLLPQVALRAGSPGGSPLVPAEIAPPSRYADTLTGNWGGVRDDLAGRGVTFDFSFTQYLDSLLSGNGSDHWESGERIDAFLNFDTGKLGLWEGGGFHTHLESRFGEARGIRGGTLWPVNTGLVLPLGERGDLVASSLYFSQKIGDSGKLMLGKVNVVDLLAADPFFGGWGRDRFQNVAFVAPPSGVLPPTIMGAIYSHRIDPFTITGMIFDPNDRTDEYWPDDLFSDGMNYSLGASWSGQIAGRPSSVNLTGTYSDKERIDLSEFLLPAGLRTGVKDGSYNVSLGLSHLLFESAVQPGKGFGVYGKGAIADGNPNPIQSYLVGGFAGHGVVPGRPLDHFGIGCFLYDFSDDLQNAVAPVAGFDDEQGLELYYNLAVTPWFRVTADLQVVDPARGANDTAVVGGLRANITF